MSLLVNLISNDLLKIYKQRIFIYLLISITIVLLIPCIVTANASVLNQLSRTGEEKNMFAAFYLGQYLFVSCFGSIGLNLALVFLVRTEKNSNSWKYLLTLPVPHHFYILSKLTAALLANLFIVIVMFVFVSMEALVIPLVAPTVDFTGYTSALYVWYTFMLKFLLISFAVTSFHLLVHFIISNQTLLILLSVFMPVICLFDFLRLLPYAWPIKNFWLGIKNKYSYKSWLPLLGNYEILSAIVLLLTVILIFYSRNWIYKYLKLYK